RLAQPHVLTLQLLQPLGLVHLQAAIFLAPAIVGLLRHPDRPDRLAERPTPTHQNLHLTQLADDLLGRMPFLGHLPLPPQWPNDDNRWTTSKGAGQYIHTCSFELTSRSRPREPSAAAPPTPPCRRTWPSTCRRSHPRS